MWRRLRPCQPTCARPSRCFLGACQRIWKRNCQSWCSCRNFSTPQSLQQALAAARHSVQSRAHENAPPKRSAVLPRVVHVDLPADPKFEHLAMRSRVKKERDASASDDEGESSDSDMESDDEVMDRKARWTSARKKEAKEKRRVLKKARRALQKERREQILAQTPLSWDK